MTEMPLLRDEATARYGQAMNIADADFQIESHLTLPHDEVQLWRLDLEAIRADESCWQKLLSPEEVTRASRFHFSADRQRFIAARAVLRAILGGYLATDPAGLAFSYSKRGKPSLATDHQGSDVTFNLSHSAGIALFAFARGREIGIDVEQVRHDFDIGAIAQRFFSMEEQKQLAALPLENRFDGFFRCWTRKEAYIKATGEGLSPSLHQFDVSIAAEDSDALLATRPNAGETARWSLREVPAGKGYVAALCVRGREWDLKHWT